MNYSVINEENLLNKGEYQEYGDDGVLVARGDGYKIVKLTDNCNNNKMGQIDIYIDQHMKGNSRLISIYKDPYNGETVATDKLKDNGTKLYDSVVNLCTKNKEFMADLSSAAKSVGVSINKPNDLLNLIGRGDHSEYNPGIDTRLSDYKFLKDTYKKDNFINRHRRKGIADRDWYEDNVKMIKRRNKWGDSINAQSFKPKTNESHSYRNYVPSISEFIAEQHINEISDQRIGDAYLKAANDDGTLVSPFKIRVN